MAEQNQPIAAPFPTPPPFYQSFTSSNLATLRQLRKEASTSQDNAQPNLDILSLPPELRYLLPPALPADSKFTAFGTALDLAAPSQTLADAGITQLYPSHPSVHQNPQPHMLALARALLTTFLSLVGVLSSNPELYESRVEMLQTVGYNLHDLINRYRPHQARETLVLLMEGRVERLRAEIAGIRSAGERVGRLMEGLVEQAGAVEVVKREEDDSGASKGGAVDMEDKKRIARQRAAWAAIEREVGDGS